MNNAQVIGMRQMHEMTKKFEGPVMPKETKSAVAMALTPHELNRTGTIARQNDGKTFAWDAGRELWVRTW